MAFEFRIPDIKGNDAEQLRAIRSYLYQLTQQLEWALNALELKIEQISEKEDTNA